MVDVDGSYTYTTEHYRFAAKLFLQENKVINKKSAAEGLLYTLLIIAFVLALLLPGHCATTSSSKHESSLGVPMVLGNPFTYKEGKVSAVAYVGSGNHSGLVVRIQPRNMYSLFTEDILICGVPVEMFAGKQNPLVLTYETVAHSTVEEIGCHRLVSVDEVKSSKELE